MNTKKIRLRIAYRNRVWEWAERTDNPYAEALMAVGHVMGAIAELSDAVLECNKSNNYAPGTFLLSPLLSPFLPNVIWALRNKLEHLAWKAIRAEEAASKAALRLPKEKALELVRQYRVGGVKPSEIAKAHNLPAEVVQAVLLKYSGRCI